MKKCARLLPALLVPVAAIALGATHDDEDDRPLTVSEVFIEFNSTDGDFGIQFHWDGEPWRNMKVEGPDGRTVLRVNVRRNLADQGLTEGMFESAEPPTEVLSMEQFLARFPPGEYEFEGRTLDGAELGGETGFTHVIPSPPANLSPSEGVLVDSGSPLVVSFDAVTTDLQGNPLDPELYQVVVETETDILRVFSIILEGDTAHPSVTVPAEFLVPDAEYKFEVIVQEESHNRTISETTFCTF